MFVVDQEQAARLWRRFPNQKNVFLSLVADSNLTRLVPGESVASNRRPTRILIHSTTLLCRVRASAEYLGKSLVELAIIFPNDNFEFSRNAVRGEFAKLGHVGTTRKR